MATELKSTNLNEYERYASTVKFIAIKSVSLFLRKSAGDGDGDGNAFYPILFFARMHRNISERLT